MTRCADVLRRHARQVGPPQFDIRRGDVLKAPGAECGQQIGVDDGPVAAQRGGLQAAVLLGVAYELAGGVGEGRACADHPRKGALAGLVEYLAQPVLGLALGVVARRRPAALAPRRADPLLDLAAVRETVSTGSRDIFGTYHPNLARSGSWDLA
jgi:hypothetical protein